MKPFRRRRRGRVSAEFDQNEAGLIANLAAQLIELLRDRNGASESSSDPLASLVGMSGPVLPPEDPVLARLLPDAYRDNPEDAGEFRRYTEQSLTSAKVANAERIIDDLRSGGLEAGSADEVEVELDTAGVLMWLRSLTDIRLALATRLGIETDDDIQRLADETDEAILAMADVYDWLGYVQESLVQVAD